MDLDRFVDLACLTYAGNDAPARRDEAIALRSPALVQASVHAAAVAGDLEALTAILDRDPGSIDERSTSRGWVPILSLCYSRIDQPQALECLELLLQRGADPNAYVTITECRFTALTGVMGEGESGPFGQPPHPRARELAIRLLDAGASPDESQGLYNTHFLPSNAWLELLLERGLTSRTDLEYLLGQAAVQGFTERVQRLLVAGAPVDGHNHYNRRSHLANALLEGHAEVAQLLSAAGAAPPVWDAPEQLQVAILANDASEAHRLATVVSPLQAGALHAAARHGRIDALRLALDLGVPIDGRDRQGLTALHHAARAGHLDVLRELVARGASLTVRDPQHGGTPLGHAQHVAARWPHPPEIVAFLEQQP